MKRVLLVATNQERRPYPVAPLGVCLLAEALSISYDVTVFDGMFAAPDALRAVVREVEPDVVGLGIRNIDDLSMERPRDYLPTIRERFLRPIRETTDAPVILGGAGYSLFPRALIEALGADFGVLGEGERSLRELLLGLEAGRRGRALAEIPGVVVPGVDRIASRAPTGAPDDPLVIGPSNIDRWIDFSTYLPRGTYPIQTKRGCDQHCIYCTYPHIEGAAHRLRSPAAIADEIDEARSRLGDVTFEFVDSIFNDPPGHAEAICEELIRRRASFKLRAMGLNPRGVSVELLRMMKRAGFVQMDCTPDSASDRVLERVGKGFCVRDLERAAEAIREAELPTLWFFLFGGPGETEETFRETLRFIDESVDERDMVYMWAGMRIYPHTRLHHQAIRDGVVAADDDLLEARFYVSPELGRQRCVALIDEACARRPSCVPAWESDPDPSMMREAFRLRRELGTQEPMFRTLIRLRRRRMGGRADK